jgi:cytochrome c oxidase assembly factor CtaG
MSMPSATLGVLSPPVTLHGLLFGFQSGLISFVALGLDLCAVAWYLACRHRLSDRGRHWPASRAVTFVLGVLTIVIATESGLASYDDSVFTMHVIQHLLLMNVAPILLALGAPMTLALQASRRRTQQRLLRLLHSRVVETVTFPVVAAIITYVTMIVYFLTPVYVFSEQHPLIHDLFHLHFLIAGCIYWWPVVGLDPSRWRLSYPARLGYLASGIPVNAILGVALTNQRISIDTAIHTVADTHAGGAILWGGGELLIVAALGVMFVQWSNFDRRESGRLDRRLDRELAAEGALLAGGTVGPIPPEPPPAASETGSSAPGPAG